MHQQTSELTYNLIPRRVNAVVTMICWAVCARGEAALSKDVSGEGTFELSFDAKQLMLQVLKNPDVMVFLFFSKVGAVYY